MRKKPVRLGRKVLFCTLMLLSGCSDPAPPAQQTGAAAGSVTRPLERGAYAVLQEASTPEMARVDGVRQIVLAYDRRKYSGAAANEPLAYIAIDPADYVPLLIEGSPEMSKDGHGKSILTVSLTRENAERTEAFTRAHLGGRIATSAVMPAVQVSAMRRCRTLVSDCGCYGRIRGSQLWLCSRWRWDLGRPPRFSISSKACC